MLSVSQVDRVRLHLQVPKGIYWPMETQFTELAHLHGTKPQKVLGNKALVGRWIELIVDGERLRISLCRQYGRRWIEYQFTGAIDVRKFEERLVLLWEATLCHAIVYGTVKRLEFAVDFAGRHTSAFLFHRLGAKTSKVMTNAAKNGTSYYVGSRQSSAQFIAYDKGQELADKQGLKHGPALLRLEARLLNRKESLAAIAQALENGSERPFENVRVIPMAAAKALKSNVAQWHHFIDRAAAVGVPRALAESPSRKTFLTYLEKIATPMVSTPGPALVGWMSKLLPMDLLWITANSFQLTDHFA